MRIRDRLPIVRFDHKLDTRFWLFNSVSRRRRSSNDRCDGRTGYLPLPLTFAFTFSFSFVLSEGKVCLCTRLYQLCTQLTSGSRSSFHVSARRAIASNSAASKTVTSSRATYEEKRIRFPCHHRDPELLSPSSLPGSTGSLWASQAFADSSMSSS